MKRFLPYLSLLFTLLAAGLSHQLRNRHTAVQEQVEHISRFRSGTPPPTMSEPLVRIDRQEALRDSVALFWKPRFAALLQ